MRRLARASIACVVALAGGCAFPKSATQTPVTPVPVGPVPVAQVPVAQTPMSGDAEPLVMEEPIEVIVRRYVNDMRFRLFDSAVNFVEPDLRPQFRAATDHLQTVRFTGVTIEQVDVDERGTTAIATVRWRGHWLRSPFERELRTTQHWRRAEPGNTWYITPELDAFEASPEQMRGAPAASMPPR